MNSDTSKWFEPLRDLILDRLDVLDKTPDPKQGATRELQIENHQAYLGKYILMCQEHLTADEQKELFQLTCLTPAQCKEYIVYFQWFVRCAVDRELP